MVESSGLLNRRRPLKSTGGSNPPLSARRSCATHAPGVAPHFLIGMNWRWFVIASTSRAVKKPQEFAQIQFPIQTIDLRLCYDMPTDVFLAKDRLRCDILFEHLEAHQVAQPPYAAHVIAVEHGTVQHGHGAGIL